MCFRQVVRLAGVLLRQLESLHDRVNDRVTRRSELLGGGPQKNETIMRGIGIEGGPNAFERSRPGLLNRCAYVPAPESGHVLKAPDDVVISANLPKEKHIEGKGGGSDVAVPENKSAEQTGMGPVGGIVEIAVAVHKEQEHVSVSQIGAGRNPFGAELAVLVAERQVPGRMLGHEVEHPAGQLVVMGPARTPAR